MKLSFKVLLALCFSGFVNQILFLVTKDWLPVEESTAIWMSRGSGILIGYMFAMHVFQNHRKKSGATD